MISQHHGCPLTELPYEAQHSERIGASIHQVTDEPQAVTRCIKRTGREQRFKLAHTALHISDCVSSHGMRGTIARQDQNAVSRRRYWMASAMWAVSMPSLAARSAIVRATRRMR